MHHVSLCSAPVQGYMLGLLSACLSALAGVYTEYLMKKNNDSLYWQNVQLYTQVSLCGHCNTALASGWQYLQVQLSQSLKTNTPLDVNMASANFANFSPISHTIRFGAIFNMARLLLDDFKVGFEKGPWWQRLLNGYSTTTWMVVLNLGSTGLLVSWLMKYADNIVKVIIFTVYYHIYTC